MSKASIPTIESIPEATRAETVLRLARKYILTHCPDHHIMDPDYSDEEAKIDGKILAEEITTALDELIEERKLKENSMTFDGKIIQVGGEKDATVTITTHFTELQGTRIPFYQSSTITITPFQS